MFKLFRNFSKKDIGLIFCTFGLVAAQVWLELKMPDFMSEITKLVQTEGSEMSEILMNGGLMLACALGSFVAVVGAGYCSSIVAANFSKNLRNKIFEKVESLDMEAVKRLSTSSLITRTTNDVTQIQMLVSMGTSMMIRSPLTAIWAIVKISNKSWQWSATTGIAVVILLGLVGTVMAIVVPKFKLVQKLTDKLNGATRENLKGIRVVRAFNAERYQEKKFEHSNAELTKIQIFNQRIMALISPIMYLVMQGVALLIYLIGAYLIDGALMADKLTVFSEMIVFSTYAMHVIMSFLMLAIIFVMLPRAQVSAERINEVLDEENKLKDGTYDDDETAERGVIEFRKVSFKYPDAEEYLLRDISFTAKPGETVAFIGSTGSGKSSLMNLVPRFYDVTEGEIFVDGINVKDYKQTALREKIGYIPQKAIMFTGTVASNIKYGDAERGAISDADMRAAIKVAQAKNFVEKLDKQYDAHVAQGGTNLSGGQKQRLSIARAVARRPEIYIFDDTFSALDYKTDAALRKDLKKYTKDATSLIVAQRIGTIMHADKILVLDGGSCVGMGTHAELLKKCKVYKEIAMSQLTQEELNV
ncbi:ABC transporter ATP-binding protein [Candidatus Saccharibacteria bacterium]|nr:ABC transporter ATP-binding protein [Candidatus Saccharibacteria bacterium]